VSDKVGNTASGELRINTDWTRPIATVAVSPAANASGWHNASVTVSFTGIDTLSGISACSPDKSFEADGERLSTSGYCVDIAQNFSPPVWAEPINIDKTPPAVEVTGVEDGATYILGSVPEAGCATSDLLSGVAAQASVSVTGGASNNVGVYNVTCSGARDKADNITADVHASYTVEYDFAGFFSPANREINNAIAGDTIPIKFSLAGDFGLDVLISTTSAPVDCATGQVIAGASETWGAGPNPFKHVDSRYQYQWETEESWNNTCRVFTLTLDDGSSHTTLIDFNESY
jgi:hypothetical protein